MTKYTKAAAMKYVAALALMIGVALASPALAAQGLDSSFTAMSKSGTHQFYVWCTGKRDSTQSAQGENAKAAQTALARKVGGRCWPVWQGLK